MQDLSAPLTRFLSRPHLAEYQLTPEEVSVLERKYEIFTELVSPYSLDAAKQAAQDYSSRGEDSTLTYGEADFLSLGEVFASIKQRHGGLTDRGVFYDLGSVSST